ncbi:unnamed protein product [Closterium sp. NIES-65]|nr:unnamed protein product [Closterium sp. NIES-65]
MAGVEVSAAAVEAAAAVAVGAEVVEVAEVEEAVAEKEEEEVVALRRGVAPVCGVGLLVLQPTSAHGDRAGEQVWGVRTPTQRLLWPPDGTLWPHLFPEATEIPCWGELSRQGARPYLRPPVEGRQRAAPHSS